MNNSESRGGVSEFSSTVGAVASPVPAVGVLPVDEVQALLDDLAPACGISVGEGECPNVAEWLGLLSCDCGADDWHAMCSDCHAHAIQGLLGCPDDDFSCVVLTRSERIRSKPTK